MDAASYTCRSCGAPVAPSQVAGLGTAGPLACAYCGSVLLTVSCPGCLGLILAGMRYCPNCGARASRVAGPDLERLPCPRCRRPLAAATVGATPLGECLRCGGAWLEHEAFAQLCADRERQAAVLAAPPAPATSETAAAIRYVPCPRCGTLMTRRQLARGAKVVVDTCVAHGVWLDRDELRQTVEFIRSGGLDRAREKQKAELENERRRLEVARRSEARSFRERLSRH